VTVGDVACSAGEEGVGTSSEVDARLVETGVVELERASRPVVCIMDPSLRDRMSVDCTPGRDVR
jgi:hypothetical protein